MSFIYSMIYYLHKYLKNF